MDAEKLTKGFEGGCLDCRLIFLTATGIPLYLDH